MSDWRASDDEREPRTDSERGLEHVRKLRALLDEGTPEPDDENEEVDDGAV